MAENRSSLIYFLKESHLVLDASAKRIAESFQFIHLKKNDYLLKEGKICNDYFFLERGCMRAYTFDSKGAEVTTWFAYSNQVVFEVASFFQRKPSKENIQALTDCLGWYCNFDQLQTLFHTSPEFREFGRMILVRNMVALKEKMLSMINLTAEERYESLIQSEQEIFQYASLKHIASYLGITDTSLSRIRKEITKK